MTRAKTLTISVSHEPDSLFAWLAEPENMPQWNSVFCKSIEKQNGRWTVQSPRGNATVKFLREDRARVLDVVIQSVGEQVCALRVFPSGEGSEIVMTLCAGTGMADSAFQEQCRWIERGVRSFKKPSIPEAVAASTDVVPAADSTAGDGASTATETPAVPLDPSLQKIFVGNLPFDWTSDQLREHFAPIGEVKSAEIATFGRSKRSRGFGFVVMGGEAETQSAIEKLHNSEAGGRKITVRLSKESRKQPAGEQTQPQEQDQNADAGNVEVSEADANTVLEPGNDRFNQRPAQPSQRSGRGSRGGRDRGGRGPGPRPSHSGAPGAQPGGRNRRPRRESRGGRFDSAHHDGDAPVIETSGYYFMPRSRKPAGQEPVQKPNYDEQQPMTPVGDFPTTTPPPRRRLFRRGPR